VPPSCIQ